MKRALDGNPITMLITGSRDWPYRLTIEHAIDVVRLKHPCSPITVIHGDCESGADAMANDYALSLHFDVKGDPADWSSGRSGGPIRNRRMVDKLRISPGPVCLAFQLDGSRGTGGTLDLVRQAHLPWRLYSATSRHPGIVNYVDWRGRINTYPTVFVPLKYVTAESE
jgi:hypothetical protein